MFSLVLWRPGDAAEASVLEPVAVSVEGDDLGVVDEAVDHGGDNVAAEGLAPAKGLLEVTMRLALSYLDETSWKNRLAASGSNGM